MRLQELYIKDYKVLHDFIIRFDEESAVSVLIGENGSGKTTVVECLTLIFAELYRQNLVADLYTAVTFPFAFSLRYRLFRPSPFDSSFSQEFGDGYFDVILQYEQKLSVRIQVDDEHIYETPEQISTFLLEEGQSIRPVRYLFPANVVLYYSGISTVLKALTDSYQQSMILGTLDGETQNNSDLFYFKPENFPALLIGLLCFQYGDVPDRLESDFQIEKVDAFDRITIKLRRPVWAKSRSTAETFWGAKGDLANFPAVIRDRIYTEDALFERDSITFTIRTPSQLTSIWSFYGEEKSLFTYLITLQANGLIEYIDVDLRKDRKLIVPYQRLSEGEKQLLVIMALRELLAAGENTLFLFDEPDTYLHPEWKRNFIAHFQPEAPATERFMSYYLITTHSPGMVSGMRREQLHILRKEAGRGVLKAFSFDPYGKPEDNILFDFFGITGLRYKPVEAKLNELNNLINEGQYESDPFRELFAEMEREIGRDDIGLTRLNLEIARRKRAARAE